jgi:hypothetical protein
MRGLLEEVLLPRNIRPASVEDGGPDRFRPNAKLDDRGLREYLGETLARIDAAETVDEKIAVLDGKFGDYGTLFSIGQTLRSLEEDGQIDATAFKETFGVDPLAIGFSRGIAAFEKVRQKVVEQFDRSQMLRSALHHVSNHPWVDWSYLRERGGVSVKSYGRREITWVSMEAFSDLRKMVRSAATFFPDVKWYSLLERSDYDFRTSEEILGNEREGTPDAILRTLYR